MSTAAATFEAETLGARLRSHHYCEVQVCWDHCVALPKRHYYHYYSYPTVFARDYDWFRTQLHVLRHWIRSGSTEGVVEGVVVGWRLSRWGGATDHERATANLFKLALCYKSQLNSNCYYDSGFKLIIRVLPSVYPTLFACVCRRDGLEHNCVP